MHKCKEYKRKKIFYINGRVFGKMKVERGRIKEEWKYGLEEHPSNRWGEWIFYRRNKKKTKQNRRDNLERIFHSFCRL